jgi:hypothetical protein
MAKMIDAIVDQIAESNPDLFDSGAKRGTGSKAQGSTDTDNATTECVHVAAGEVCLHCTMVCDNSACTVGHKKPLTLRGTRNMIIAATKAKLTCPCGGSMYCQRLADDIKAAADEAAAKAAAAKAEASAKAAKAAQILADAEDWITEDDDPEDEAPTEEAQPEAPTEEAQPEAAEEDDNDLF